VTDENRTNALEEKQMNVLPGQRRRAGLPALPPERKSAKRVLQKDFWVALPSERCSFPEPLRQGATPGFKYRGTKGWMWTPQQYLAEIPFLARFKMNFLMSCYLSWFDIENHPDWHDGEANRWWEDLPAWKKEAYEEVVRQCQAHEIDFCFGMSPSVCCRRSLDDNFPESVELLWKHFGWAQKLGVKWFNLDITEGVDASSQARVVNAIFRRLRANDTDAQMIFCPTLYWGDGTGKVQQPYLETLARELDADIHLFWTGDAVVGRITRRGAESFRRISGHRIFLWDNYPVNDDQPAMHLGPVIDREPDLCEVIDGYMSNPHSKQNEINRVPLATCADYAWNPHAYDPSRSIGQAIMHLAETAPQRELLRDLVEAYPGMLIYGRSATDLNCVRDQYERISGAPHSRQAALAFITRVGDLSLRLKQLFPAQYAAERKTIDDDLHVLKRKFQKKYQAPG
jgi:hypothetical protein